MSPDYLRTPEPDRTPETSDALATYLPSPQLAEAATRQCLIDKLSAQVRQAATAKGETRAEAQADVDHLRSDLVARAIISGPAAPPGPR